MNWCEQYQDKLHTAEEAVKIVKDGDVVYIGTASSVACVLAEALFQRKNELNDVVFSSGTTLQILPHFKEDKGSPFSVLTYFAGPAEREAMKHNNCMHTSLHLSRADQWCQDYLKDGVAFLDVSEPDEFGYMSYGAYGTSMHDDVAKVCSRVVVQVNKQEPYVYGMRSLIHVSEVDAIVEVDQPMAEAPDLPPSEALKEISSFIVDQIPDGACIQLGLGGLSGAIGFGLENKNDLGIHSEMFTNSMMHLMELGVITNKRKNFIPGKAVAGFALGSKELYRYVDHNPNILFSPYTYVNNPVNIGKNDNFMSINTAMAVDLFGQVAADNLGGRQVSAVGGQVDYVRGAQLSKGGKSFIALTSVMEGKKGRSSRIVAALPPGTAVTTSRQDVQYVVTEYGCVNLKPLNMADRAKAVIRLAHPEFRDELTEQAKKYGILS